MLAVGDNQGKVWLCDAHLGKRPSGQASVPRCLPALTPRVNCFPNMPWFTQPLAFSPDGRQLAVATHEATVHIYDVVTKSSTLVPWQRRGAPFHVAFSPGGQLLTIGGKTGKWENFVTIWDLANAREELTLTEHNGETAVALAAFDPRGGKLALGAKDRTVELWHLPIGQQSPASGR
jgi:WD40 repeat protein